LEFTAYRAHETIFQPTSYWRMWWHQTPKTDAERAEEIAQLTKKRDNLLNRAPEAVLIRQAVVVCFLGIMIFLFAGQIFAGAVGIKFAALVAVTLAGAFLLIVLYRSRNLPPIGDQWGMSRLLSYEGDSPQDVQDRLERLRSEEAASNHQNDVGGA
jgi:hypothetical protein